MQCVAAQIEKSNLAEHKGTFICSLLQNFNDVAFIEIAYLR